MTFSISTASKTVLRFVDKYAAEIISLCIVLLIFLVAVAVVDFWETVLT